MRYPGGKGACFRHIINRMAPHRIYIESHLGGGNVLERKKPARHNIGIDVDRVLIDSWQRRKRRDDIGVDQYVDAAGFTFVCDDACSYLSSYTWVGDELVYSDPPYLMETRKGGRLYTYEYSDADHIALIDVLRSLPCYVMISGYKSSLYETMLQGWQCDTFSNTTRGGKVVKYLWMNYRPNGVLHDYRFLGENFREREKITRKKKRWVSRLKSMEPGERNCIAEAIEAISRESRPVPAELARVDPCRKRAQRKRESNHEKNC